MPPTDQNYYPPDVTEGETDLLSSHLRDFSQQLEILRTNGPVVLGTELFWPLNLQNDNPANLPFWPNLVDVSVEYAGVTPSGEWLFDRDPEEEEEDEEQTMDDIFGDEEHNYPEYVRIPLEDRKSRYFRTRIIAGHVDRLYASAGRAALQMPKLRWMKLENVDLPRYSLEYEVRAGRATLTWRSENHMRDPYEKDASVRLEMAKRLYRPDEQVFDAWSKVALQYTGRDLEIDFKEWGY